MSNPFIAAFQDVLLEHFELDADGNPKEAAEAAGGGGDAAAPAAAPAEGGGGAAAAAAAGDGVKRVIIFTTLRETVGDIAAALERYAPHIKPRVFVGQGARGNK